MNPRRVKAMVRRYFYNLVHNYDRMADMFYWPLMDILVWGLTGLYFANLNTSSPYSATVILTGLIFWIITWRAQYEITTNLLSEMWDRNLVNIFSSPLTVFEWILAVIIFGAGKMIVSLAFSATLAFILYGYNFFQFGWWLIPISINLVVVGWVLGFTVAGIIIRYGMKIQTLAWAGAYIIVPFSALYYPVGILPHWAQKISMIIPSSYLFEALRQHIFTGAISLEKIILSFALNFIYLILSIYFFMYMFRKSKKRGLGSLI